MHQLEYSDVDMVIPVDGIRSAVALAWDSHSDSIFWTDIESDTINRAHLNGSQQRAIVSSNLGKDLLLPGPFRSGLTSKSHFLVSQGRDRSGRQFAMFSETVIRVVK
jgi:hypothetical protein